MTPYEMRESINNLSNNEYDIVMSKIRNTMSTSSRDDVWYSGLIKKQTAQELISEGYKITTMEFYDDNFITIIKWIN